MAAGLGLVWCSGAFAKAPNPLERMTPVPANEPIPIVDFVRPPLFSSPELNPAGTHFAASTTVSVDRTEIVVGEIGTKKLQRLHGPGKRDIRDVDWLGDDQVIFSLVVDNRYSEGLYVAPVSELRRAYPVDHRNVDRVLSSPRATPHRPLVWIQKSAFDRGNDMGVVQIDALVASDNPFAPGSNRHVDPTSIEYGTLAKVVRSFPAPNGGDTRGYWVDAAGELAYAVTIKDGEPRLHRFDGKQWVASPADLDGVEIVAVGEQPGKLYVLGPREDGKPRALRVLDAATGELGAVVHQDEKYDLHRCRAYRHPADGRVLGLRFEREIPTTVWFDEGYRKLQRKIENTLARVAPGSVVAILGSDRAENRFFVSTGSARRPTGYFLIDLEKNAVTGVASSVMPWLDPQRLHDTICMNYPNRDGTAVDGYLTLPAGASKEKPAPLVVLAHGGPWARDRWGFNPQVQFLASRGYAVFQPNYRGSLGTQWRFPAEDLWAFRKMHDDVTDGVKKLLQTGLIDADRVAIMGGSFGAYLAVCGVTYEPELYRCAVATSGVFDWAEVIAESKRFESDGIGRGRAATLRRFLGDPKANQERFDSLSPIGSAAQIKVPVFVAHGKEDKIASVEQSKRLVAALKKNGVPHTARFERDEGHGMAELENRVELYTEIEAFLATNLAARAGAKASGGVPAAQ